MKIRYVVLAGCMVMLVACGGDSITTPEPVVAPAPAPVVAAPVEPEAPAAEAEEDLSGGRALSAEFITQDEPWTAKIVNTTYNTGTVSYCIYDLAGGFAAQGLPKYEKQFTASHGANFTVDFFDVYEDKSECGEKLTFQADLIRGKVCGEAPNNHGGYNFGAVFGTYESKGEGAETSSVKVDTDEGEWSKCTEAAEGCEKTRTVVTTTTTTYKNSCTQETREEVKVTEEIQTESCTCACVETGPVSKPQVPIWYENNILQGRCQPEEVFPLETFSAACNKNCHILGVQTIVEEMVCTDDGETTRNLCKNVACPPPPPSGACYYNISGNREHHRWICEHTPGGDPIRPGQWGNWNNQQSQHCKFTVPGIYADPLRKFQLDPGQSDPLCNKY